MSLQILENTEKKISYLKKTRVDIFSVENKHFGWKQVYSIKDLKKYRDLQNKIFINKNTLKLIIDNFKKWLSIPTYLMFEIDDGLIGGLASKRGNKVYEHFLDEKLNKQLSFMKGSEFPKRILRNKKGFRNQKVSNVCFVTLTCDTKKYNNNLVTAWLNLEQDYNIFITRIRKKYGKCWIMKAVEAVEKGFPHIHLLIITEKEFDVYKPIRRKCSNKKCKKYFNINSQKPIIKCPHCNSKLNHPFRSRDRNELKGYWGAFIDLVIPNPQKQKGGECLNFMKDYIFKDMIKAYKYKEKRTHQNYLSLALGWLFGKQCFSVSGLNSLTEFITDTSIIQTQIEDIKNKNPDKNIKFLGLLDLKSKSCKPPPIQIKIPKSDPNYEDYLNGIYEVRKKRTFFFNEIKPEKEKTLFDFEPRPYKKMKIKFRDLVSNSKLPPLSELKTQNVLDMEVILRSGRSLFEFKQDQRRRQRSSGLNSSYIYGINNFDFEDRIRLAIEGRC